MNRQVIRRELRERQSIRPLDDDNLFPITLFSQSKMNEVIGIFEPIQIGMDKMRGAGVLLDKSEGWAVHGLGRNSAGLSQPSNQHSFPNAKITD